MRKNCSSIIVVFLVLLVSFLAFGCGNEPIPTPYVAEEFVVCNASGNQITPSISGNIVVWADDRNYDASIYNNSDILVYGPYDIFGYNLSNGIEFPICTAENSQGSPDIDGTFVVWQDDRNYYAEEYNSDIYGYDLSMQSEVVICNESHAQETPSISGDTVTWRDDRDGLDNATYIYGCHINTGEEFPISTYESLKFPPVIYKDVVTWLDFRKVNLCALPQQPHNVWNTEIYCFNLSADLEFAVTNDEIMQDLPGPDLYGNTLVWSECSQNLCGIHVYDLTTHTKSSLSTGADSMRDPAIYGSIVVWSDYRNGNGDIYGYNMETGEEFAVCVAPGTQHYPAISGNIVVWADEREGLDNTYDIYGARLTFDNP